MLITQTLLIDNIIYIIKLGTSKLVAPLSANLKLEGVLTPTLYV